MEPKKVELDEFAKTNELISKYGVNECPVCKTDPRKDSANWLSVGYAEGIICERCGVLYYPCLKALLETSKTLAKEAEEIAV